MIKILLGFLPWIVYFLLTGPTKSAHLLSLSFALGITLLFDFKEIKKGFVLAWGGLLYFATMLFIAAVTSSEWPMLHASLLGNIALMSIVWTSLLIGKPFTIQYAREVTAERFWKSPLFIRINNVLTIVWGLSFLLLVLMNLSQQYFKLSNGWIYQSLTYIPTLFAIFFTQKFPEWYKTKFSNQAILTSQTKQKNNLYLQDGFAPTTNELDENNLTVVGKLPDDLQGVYMRNGPNPDFEPYSYTYPFDGDGMIHAVYFNDGKVDYRNRFVLTDQLKTEKRLGKAMYGGIACPFIRDEKALNASDSKMPVKIGRFIHVIQQNNTYLAMHESTSAYEITRNLETIGEWNPKKTPLAPDINAHSRVDPDNGRRYFISYSEKPEITYLVLDHDAEIFEEGEIEIPYSCMVHDFVMTKQYLIIFLSPAILDIVGGQNCLLWKPELQTRVLILKKENLTEKPKIVITEPFFSFHYVNAFERNNNQIVVDHVRYEKIGLEIDNVSPNLFRTTIDLISENCINEKLSDYYVEFPRINESFDSKPYRYGYLCHNSTMLNRNIMNAIMKYDFDEKKAYVHNFGDGCEVDEPIFVPKKISQDEDDGYVIFYLYHSDNKRSELIILDAKNITSEPIARVQMPQRVPHGLHGSWMTGG